MKQAITIIFSLFLTCQVFYAGEATREVEIQTAGGRVYINPKIEQASKQGYINIYHEGKKDTISLSSLKPFTITTASDRRRCIIGKTYKEAKITSISPIGIQVTYSNGSAKIKFSQLAYSSKRLFVVDKKAISEYYKKIDEGRKLAQEKAEEQRKYLNDLAERRRKAWIEESKKQKNEENTRAVKTKRTVSRRSLRGIDFSREARNMKNSFGGSSSRSSSSSSSSSVCPKCGGTGRYYMRGGGSAKCPFCRGKGKVSQRTSNRLSAPVGPDVINTSW